MLPDYHLHTPLCKHAAGEPEAYADRAIARGIPEIAFTDHVPMPAWYDPENRMTEPEFPRYRALVDRVRKARPNFPIRFGVEADFVPGTEDYLAGFLATHPLDYVLGSIHFLGDFGFDNEKYAEEWSRRDVLAAWQDYFRLVQLLAKSRLFDALAHPDLVKKFGHVPEGDLSPMFREALACVKEHGLALEVNTAGLRRPCREIYPSRRLLEIAIDLGIPAVTGSDAHAPSEVGAGFEAAEALLRDVGYREASRFEKRRRIPFPLS
jgi:histidinol-phosphatase (PHP family)